MENTKEACHVNTHFSFKRMHVPDFQFRNFFLSEYFDLHFGFLQDNVGVLISSVNFFFVFQRKRLISILENLGQPQSDELNSVVFRFVCTCT